VEIEGDVRKLIAIQNTGKSQETFAENPLTASAKIYDTS